MQAHTHMLKGMIYATQPRFNPFVPEYVNDQSDWRQQGGATKHDVRTLSARYATHHHFCVLFMRRN